MKFRKHAKGAFGLVGTGLFAGGGAMALAGMNNAAATHASTGLANMSAMLPATGSMLGAGMVLDSAKGLRGFARNRRKRR